MDFSICSLCMTHFKQLHTSFVKPSEETLLIKQIKRTGTASSVIDFSVWFFFVSKGTFNTANLFIFMAGCDVPWHKTIWGSSVLRVHFRSFASLSMEFFTFWTISFIRCCVCWNLGNAFLSYCMIRYGTTRKIIQNVKS